VLEPDPDGAIREGRLARVDYRTTVVLDRLPEGLDSGADSGEVSARIVSYRNGQVAVEVDGRRGSVLVLHDLYYPGWEVAIDGEPAEMLRANYLFRGVWVPAGRHTVTFRFRPFAPGGVAGTLRRYLDARHGAGRPGPSDGFPEVGPLEPSRGSGRRQTFRFRFRDPDGAGDLTRQTILFNDTLSVAAGCYLYHEAGRVQLSDDSGVNWQGPVTLGEPGALENSQCRVEAGPSSASGAGDELTLSVDLTFFGAFEGIHSVWAYTEDSGGRSAFGRIGYWALRTDPTFLDRLRLLLGLPGR
jgi:hypothetical protein